VPCDTITVVPAPAAAAAAESVQYGVAADPAVEPVSVQLGFF
jgi:hypothetical protein